MRCAIYKSTHKSNAYLYVERRDDFKRVPGALLAMLGRLQFVMDLELRADRRLAQADVHEVCRQLGEQGFYLQMPPDPVTGALRS